MPARIPEHQDRRARVARARVLRPRSARYYTPRASTLCHVATIADLLAAGFTASSAVAKALNIDHPDPAGRGPFCRVLVTTTAHNAPGTYAWVVDDEVMYIGKAKELVQIVKGYGMGRAYNDYTYMPASKVVQLGNPRVRVNGLLNAALVAGQTATWWWVATPTETDALDLEAALIRRWDPSWNRARPQR
jgi:hypothetical protein